MLKIKDTRLKKDNQPIDLYHATMGDSFDCFYPLSHFGTQKAARELFDALVFNNLSIKESLQPIPDDFDYFHSHLDVSKPLAGFFDSLNSKNLIPHVLSNEQVGKLQGGRTYKVHLLIKNPLRMYDFGSHKSPIHWLSGYTFPDKATKFIFSQPREMAAEEIEKELDKETLFPKPLRQKKIQNALNEKAPNEDIHAVTHDTLWKLLAFQRMIRFFESIGYDGITYENKIEDRGSTSYVNFRQDQVFNALTGEKSHHKNKPSIENDAELRALQDQAIGVVFNQARQQQLLERRLKSR